MGFIAAHKDNEANIIVAHNATAAVFQKINLSYKNKMDISNTTHRHLNYGDFIKISLDDATLCNRALSKKVIELSLNKKIDGVE